MITREKQSTKGYQHRPPLCSRLSPFLVPKAVAGGRAATRQLSLKNIQPTLENGLLKLIQQNLYSKNFIIPQTKIIPNTQAALKISLTLTSHFFQFP